MVGPNLAGACQEEGEASLEEAALACLVEVAAFQEGNSLSSASSWRRWTHERKSGDDKQTTRVWRCRGFGVQALVLIRDSGHRTNFVECTGMSIVDAVQG